MSYDYDDHDYSYGPPDLDYDGQPLHFAREGSALRAASRENPRIHPCPTCGTENVLTPADVRRGYQCDRCADADEGIGMAY